MAMPMIPLPWSQAGYYQYGGGAPVPVRIDRIELSGWAHTASGPVPFSRLNLIPSQTGLQGWCNCPIRWQVGPSPALAGFQKLG